MPPRRAGIGRTALLVLVQCLLVFLLVEVALRLARSHFEGLDRLLYLPEVSTRFDEVETLEELLSHSMLGYRPFKGSSGFMLNSRGLRTPEYEREPAPGTYRVVVIGDSFAYASGGTPYGFHWPYLTGVGLAEARSEPVEVVNLGAPGVGAAFYYRMWQLEGSKLGADQVVLSLFLGNDLTDEQGMKAELGGERSLLDRLVLRSLAVRAARALVLLQGLEESGSEPESELSGDSAGGPVAPAGSVPTPSESSEQPVGGYEVMAYRENFDPERPTMRPKVYMQTTFDRMRVAMKRNRRAVDDRMGRIFAALGAIRDEVEAAGGRFTVMLIPDEYQVSESLRRVVLERLGTLPEDYDLRQPQDVALEWCESTGIDCLDLLPALDQASRDARQYKPRDTHWNYAGNALAARVLLDHLLDGET